MLVELILSSVHWVGKLTWTIHMAGWGQRLLILHLNTNPLVLVTAETVCIRLSAIWVVARRALSVYSSQVVDWQWAIWAHAGVLRSSNHTTIETCITITWIHLLYRAIIWSQIADRIFILKGLHNIIWSLMILDFTSLRLRCLWLVDLVCSMLFLLGIRAWHFNLQLFSLHTVSFNVTTSPTTVCLWMNQLGFRCLKVLVAQCRNHLDASVIWRHFLASLTQLSISVLKLRGLLVAESLLRVGVAGCGFETFLASRRYPLASATRDLVLRFNRHGQLPLMLDSCSEHCMWVLSSCRHLQLDLLTVREQDQLFRLWWPLQLATVEYTRGWSRGLNAMHIVRHMRLPLGWLLGAAQHRTGHYPRGASSLAITVRNFGLWDHECRWWGLVQVLFLRCSHSVSILAVGVLWLLRR